MKKKFTENAYASGRYLKDNPTLHEEDADWKFLKIQPLLEIFLTKNKKNKTVSLLEVGGGMGKMTQKVGKYFLDKKIKTDKYFLDISPQFLMWQIKNNPDYKKKFCCELSEVKLENKYFDLVLVIDVLEHIPNLGITLSRLAEICRFAIIKIPLENNLTLNFLNLVTGGKFKKQVTLGKLGHVQSFSALTAKETLENAGGKIIAAEFTNCFEYFLKSSFYQKRNSLIHKIIFWLGWKTHCLSPKLAAILFNDFYLCLISYE